MNTVDSKSKPNAASLSSMIDQLDLEELNSYLYSQSHTSKGNQPKWRLNNTWYKADHLGYEALAEVLISRLLTMSNVENYVKYRPVKIRYRQRELIGCRSQNFLQKDELFLPFERLHRSFTGRSLSQVLSGFTDVSEKLSYTVSFIEDTTSLQNVGAYITLLLELDTIFLNEDRHTNNLAVVRNEKTGKFRFCPLFDNGLSLLSDLQDYPLTEDVYSCISRVQAKPFSSDFDEQLDAAEALYGSPLRLHFRSQDILSQVDAFSGLYSEEILQRTRQVLLEQMRRYSIYFQ